MRRIVWAAGLATIMAMSSYAQTPTPGPTETQTPTNTPFVLDFNPDLDGNGLLDSADLIRFLTAWQLRDFFIAPTPSPTPQFAALLGFVTSAETNLGIAGATVIAGPDSVFTEANGFFEIPMARVDTDSLSVANDGFVPHQQPVEIEFPSTILNIVLFPLGFPTPTATLTQTEPLAASPTPTPTGSAQVPTSTHTPSGTSTSTTTPMPTPTLSRTPTPPPLLGVWEGDLIGTVFNGTDLVWTVTSGTQALAQIGRNPPLANLAGTYSLNGNSVIYNGTSGAGSLQLQMTWDGADEMTAGTYLSNIEGFGADSGSVESFTRTP